MNQKVMTKEQKLTHDLVEAQAAEAQLRRQMNKLAKELSDARELMASGKGHSTELKRRMEEELEREREKRVAGLQQQGMKRLMNQGLARGWSAWHGKYSEHLRKHRLMKKAGGWLTRPKLIAAYMHWHHGWLFEMQLNRTATHEQRLAMEVAERTELENRVGRLTKELAEARELMASGKGQEAEQRRRMEEELEREKEKRVEHLKSIAIRRIALKDLSRGWSGWHGMWAERLRQQRVLKQSLGRLMRPALIGAYAHWRRGWEIELKLEASMNQQQKLQAAIFKGKELEAANAQLHHELKHAREAMISGRGQEMEAQRRLQEDLEREKEKRVQHLQHIGMRRMLHQGLAKGWSAWHGKWLEKTRKSRLMQKTSSRLLKPKLSAAYFIWRRDWEMEFMRKLKQAKMSKHDDTAEIHARLAAEVARREDIEHQFERARLETDQQLSLQAVALVEARKAATDAAAQAAVEKAAADNARRSAEGVSEVVQRLADETARRMDAESEIERVKTHAEERLAMQNVALVEARKAATDALSRVSMERAEFDSAREAHSALQAELQRAKDAEAQQASAAIRAQNLLYEHQEETEVKLNSLLREHRDHLTREITRMTEEYERRLAELRLQIALQPSPPPMPLIIEPPPTPRVHVETKRPITERLNNIIKEKGLRTIDLFRELDIDVDGYLSREDWRIGLAKLGCNLADEELLSTFADADADKSGAIEFAELELYLKGKEAIKSPPPRPPTVPKRNPTAAPRTPLRRNSMSGNSPKDKNARLLAALASSMGVKPNPTWFDEAQTIKTTGKNGAEDFETMMKDRASGFGHADLNQDGKLDFDEFCAMVRYRETTQYTDKQLRQKFSEIDADGSGSVDLHEFIAFSLRDAVKRSKGKAIDIFQIWDTDKSGYIDQKEFGKAIVALGFVASLDDITMVFNQLDEDRSGQIEYKELAKMLRRVGSGRVSPAPPPAGTSSK